MLEFRAQVNGESMHDCCESSLNQLPFPILFALPCFASIIIIFIQVVHATAFKSSKEKRRGKGIGRQEEDERPTFTFTFRKYVGVQWQQQGKNNIDGKFCA